ncbi:MAG: Tripartite ATP-independent periplasmic transporter DctQ component [Paenibacillus sp.]|nr:Tripartite ATP-independent periplasmic transporter DctQ component [Paenibacillus sp.]
MQALRMFNCVLLKIASWGVIVSMAAIAIVIPYEVFGRYILSKMSMWSGEFSQFSLVWASMMGGAVGLKKGYQVGITTLTDNLPPGPAKLVQGAGLLAMLIFLALMTYYGVNQMLMNIGQVSSSIGISMSIPYAALPLGFSIMFFITIEQTLIFLGVSDTRREK